MAKRPPAAQPRRRMVRDANAPPHVAKNAAYIEDKLRRLSKVNTILSYSIATDGRDIEDLLFRRLPVL